MKRIEKLTEAQRAQIPAHVEKWIKIGLSTEEIDLPIFTKGVKAAYEFANIEWHDNIIVVDNPLVIALSSPIASYIINNNSAVRSAVNSDVNSAVNSDVNSAVNSAVRSAVNSAVRSAVNSAVRSVVDSVVDSAVSSAVGSAVNLAVDSAVGSAVRSEVSSAVRSAVRSAVGSAVSSAVNSAVRSAVSSAVNSEVDLAVGSAVSSAVNSAVNSEVDSELIKYIDNSYNYYLWGQFSVGGWYWGNAYVSYIIEVCGLELSEDILARAKAYDDINCSSCMWYPSEKFIMVSKRPKHIHKDSQGRLHSLTTSSIAWEGFELFHIEGVKVPKEWITDKNSLSAKEALGQKNSELRRVACEQVVGWAKIMKELNCITIDKEDDELLGELIEVTLPEHGKQKFIRVRCGTGREFVMRTSNKFNTVLEAQAAMRGKSLANFKIPAMRT